MTRARALALVALALLGLGLVWSMTCGAETAREAVTYSLREGFAPEHVKADKLDEPEPASATVVVDEVEEAATPDLGSAPEAVEEDLPRPRRPRGLRGTSFVLLIGLDNRSDRLVGRADTLIVAAFRHRDGKVAAFSIPRDLWVELPELGPARINSTVRIGEHKLGEGEGVPLIKRVIEDNFGIRIDHYAQVDHAGFVAAVDALGGVDVELQCPIRDCFWGDDRSQGCRMLDLEAGRQRLDGETALLYARSRHGRGERDRRRRQQRVLLGLARKARASGLRALPNLWRKVSPHVETDLDLEAALYYASFVLDGGLEAVGGFSITRSLVERHVTEDGKHVLLLEREIFDEALGRIFHTPLPGTKARKRCPDVDVAFQVPAR